MKKIIILSPGLFQKRDYDRFGIEILRKNFFTKVLDFTAWLHPDFWEEESKNVFQCEEYVPITNKLDFINFNIGKDSIIVIDCLIKNRKTNWVRKQLRKRNSIFVDCNLNLIPVAKNNIIELLKKSIKLIITPKKFFFKFFKFFEKKYYGLKKTYPADILVLGGTTTLKESKVKNKIFAHSMDYDIYLNLRNRPKNNKDSYVVFLDEDMVNHSDYNLLNLDLPVSEFQYYPILVQFLKKFEITTGLKVKFSIHPKSRTKNLEKYLKDFDLSVGKTAELVKDSSLVVLHASTSISYAILFKKPVIFLTSDELKRSWIGNQITNLSKVLNSKLINMSNSSNYDFNMKDLSNFDKIKYQAYVDQYLKVPNSPDIPLWEIFTENIKKIYNDKNKLN